MEWKVVRINASVKQVVAFSEVLLLTDYARCATKKSWRRSSSHHRLGKSHPLNAWPQPWSPFLRLLSHSSSSSSSSSNLRARTKQKMRRHSKRLPQMSLLTQHLNQPHSLQSSNHLRTHRKIRGRSRKRELIAVWLVARRSALLVSSVAAEASSVQRIVTATNTTAHLTIVSSELRKFARTIPSSSAKRLTKFNAFVSSYLMYIIEP